MFGKQVFLERQLGSPTSGKHSFYALSYNKTLLSYHTWVDPEVPVVDGRVGFRALSFCKISLRDEQRGRQCPGGSRERDLSRLLIS